MKDIAFQITDGLARTSVNAILWMLFSLGASMESRTMRDAYGAFEKVDHAMSEFNYDRFKAVISSLSKKGYIKKSKTPSRLELAITKEGRERLKMALPWYQKIRTWDGYLYLVSYDIAESGKKMRDLLRKCLLRIGCAMLQESFWMTPYNPQGLIDDFAQSHEIPGTILISKLGKDGAIGTEDLPTLLDRVYHLSSLNEQYKQFLAVARSGKLSPFQLSVRYASILAKDPQLPFELLPSDWLGDEAYKAVEQTMSF